MTSICISVKMYAKYLNYVEKTDDDVAINDNHSIKSHFVYVIIVSNCVAKRVAHHAKRGSTQLQMKLWKCIHNIYFLLSLYSYYSHKHTHLNKKNFKSVFTWCHFLFLSVYYWTTFFFLPNLITYCVIEEEGNLVRYLWEIKGFFFSNIANSFIECSLVRYFL